MGQKVHPVGFRLGITQTHLSKWFAPKKEYSKYLFEDSFLRKTLQQKYCYAGFEKIIISRKIENHIEIIIHAEKPYILIGKKGEKLKIFQQEIKTTIEKYRRQTINKEKQKQFQLKVVLYIIRCSQESASSIANFLIQKLEKRFSYRSALNLLFINEISNIKDPQNPRKIGLKIQISGRLNGAEIARTEWIREGEGRLPLQTLQAKIDYSSKQAHTIYGVLGIKVWVFHKKAKFL